MLAVLLQKCCRAPLKSLGPTDGEQRACPLNHERQQLGAYSCTKYASASVPRIDALLRTSGRLSPFKDICYRFGTHKRQIHFFFLCSHIVNKTLQATLNYVKCHSPGKRQSHPCLYSPLCEGQDNLTDICRRESFGLSSDHI